MTDRDGLSLCVSLGHVGGLSWWCHLVTVCQFAMDLENMFGGVMVCGENVGRSSQSGCITTTRHNRDGWCRFVTVCQLAKVLENIQSSVMEWGENIGKLSLSEQITAYPSQPLGMVSFLDRWSVCDGLRKYFWRCYGGG